MAQHPQQALPSLVTLPPRHQHELELAQAHQTSYSLHFPSSLRHLLLA